MEWHHWQAGKQNDGAAQAASTQAQDEGRHAMDAKTSRNRSRYAAKARNDGHSSHSSIRRHLAFLLLLGLVLVRIVAL